MCNKELNSKAFLEHALKLMLTMSQLDIMLVYVDTRMGM